jgi:hypothetical protein
MFIIRAKFNGKETTIRETSDYGTACGIARELSSSARRVDVFSPSGNRLLTIR